MIWAGFRSQSGGKYKHCVRLLAEASFQMTGLTAYLCINKTPVGRSNHDEEGR